ncbi:MAG: ParB/RepB/Spo0J family partition protein [Oligoflexia bacterium]|nr:ParB/RepB/Spo0J family partition protein [Oligoflexia bacterium]
MQRSDDPVTEGGVRQVGLILEIPLQRIKPFVGQPRIQFNEESLRELAESMTNAGQAMPVLVRLADKERGEYELVEGERRWRAARLAGLKMLRCEVVEVDDSDHQFRKSFVANFHRENHTPLEIAYACKRLGEQGMALSAVAAMLGKSEAWVSMYLRLLNLSDKLLALLGPSTPKDKRLKVPVALALARLNHKLQLRAYETIGREKGTQRQAEALVRRLLLEDDSAKHDNARIRKRGPDDDYRVFMTFVMNGLESTRLWREFKLQTLFKNRPPQSARQVRVWLEETVKSYREILKKIPEESD